MDTDIINRRDRQYQQIKRLREKDCINVLFIVSSLSMWNHQHLYEQMSQNPRFKTTIIFVPFRVYSDDDNIKTLSQLKVYFQQHNTPFFIYDELDFSHQSFEEQFSPDILFYPQWYGELYPTPIDIKTQIDKLICFIPYGIGITPTGIGAHEEFANYAWKIYQTSDAHLRASQNLMRCHGDNVIVVGHPRADEYALPPSYNPWKLQENRKKRVIWAPHFTISDGISPLQRSNFLQIADSIWSIAQKYNESVQFAFKPHPRLITELYKHPEWGKAKTDAYYQQWADGVNTQLEIGEYVELLKTSDAMIHDCGSFTIEYLYVHKPVMFITKDAEMLKQTDEMLDIGCEALDVHYWGFTEQDICSFIDDVVIAGNDTKKEVREEFFQKHLLQKTNKTATELIYEDICYDIWLPANQNFMKFSFVLPIYNVDKYLRQCLDSIIHQTYSNIEIICVNDGSTDSCADILAEYSAIDSRIKIITQENKGTLMARKVGIMVASGDYVLCVDPDDWLDLFTVEKIVKTLKRTNADTIQFGFEIEQGTILSKERKQEIDSFFNRQVEHINGSEAILSSAFIDNVLSYNQCGKAIRTSIAQQAFSIIPDIRCIFAEDQSTGFILFCFTNTIHGIPYKLYHYRAGVGISTKTNLTIEEYKEALNSFQMLDSLNKIVEERYKQSVLHHKILDDIQHSMICACVILGAERVKGIKNVEEWVTLLCNRILTKDIPIVLAKILFERDYQITSLQQNLASLQQNLSSYQQELNSVTESLEQRIKSHQSEEELYHMRIKRQRKKRQKERIIWILVVLFFLFSFVLFK